MIARAHRFHGHNSLRFVYQRGSSVRGPLCSLKYVENTRRTTYRTAVVVSKKMHKSAVVRNRIRRRIYEIVRQTVDEKQAYDLVFTVFSPELADIPALRLQGEVKDLLRRAHIHTRTIHGVVNVSPPGSFFPPLTKGTKSDKQGTERS